MLKRNKKENKFLPQSGKNPHFPSEPGQFLDSKDTKWKKIANITVTSTTPTKSNTRGSID